jgi:hypothetical protein
MDKITMQTIDDKADPTFNQLLGINNEGQIAGYFGSGQPGHPNKGYTVNADHDQDNFHNENFPGSAQTQVTGINNADRTVGFFVDANGNNVGFVDHDGHFTQVFDPAATPLATAPNGTPSVQQLLGINDHNVAVGFYTDANGMNHGFTYDVGDGRFNAVNVSGFANITAAAINDKGEIAGFGTFGNGQTEGFIEDRHGHVTALTGPTGAVAVQALGLNDKGTVVGDWTDAAGNMHGFLYDTKTQAYITVDAGSHTMTVLNGVNDKGQAVGFFLDAKGNTDGLLATFGGHHGHS